MDASDLIRALPNSLRGAGRPHMAGARDARLLAFTAMMVWTAPDGIDCARMRSLQIQTMETARGTD